MRSGQFVLDPVHDKHTVGQPGKGIVENLMLEAQLGHLAIGDVTGDAVHSDDLTVCVEHGAEALVDPDLGVVLANELEIDGSLDSAGTQASRPEVTIGGIH